RIGWLVLVLPSFRLSGTFDGDFHPARDAKLRLAHNTDSRNNARAGRYKGRLGRDSAFLDEMFRLVDVVIALAIHAYEVVAHDDTCGH
ncbi:MAG: hypothetical protein ACJAVK_001575, partial [Akkermansiaceae bacterium]